MSGSINGRSIWARPWSTGISNFDRLPTVKHSLLAIAISKSRSLIQQMDTWFTELFQDCKLCTMSLHCCVRCYTWQIAPPYDNVCTCVNAVGANPCVRPVQAVFVDILLRNLICLPAVNAIYVPSEHAIWYKSLRGFISYRTTNLCAEKRKKRGFLMEASLIIWVSITWRSCRSAWS